MTPIYRYPGVRPFEKADSELFFGRDRDIELLYNLIRVEQVVVLFSKSGYGKSSLINAGIIPKMLEEHPDESPHHFITVRFGNYLEGRSLSPLETVLQNVEKVFPIIDPDSLFLDHLCKPTGLWYQCKRRKWLKSRQLLFVFDQFEEFFTYPEDQQQILKAELAELLYVQIPQYLRKLLPVNPAKAVPEQAAYLNQHLEAKVLFSIRSDRVHHLDSLKDAIPDILYKRYELRALTTEQAREAITRPAQLDAITKDRTILSTFASPNFDYSGKALDTIINYLDGRGDKAGKGIETFELQLICHQVEEIIIKKQEKGDVIGLSRTMVHPYDLPNLKKIFKNYYIQQIKQLSKKERLAARLLIEEGLLSEGESPEDLRRLSIDELALLQTYQKKGATKALLYELENAFLIRREPNNTDGYNIEISHDTLMEPISESRKRRRLYSSIGEMAKMIVQGPGIFLIILIIIFFTGIGGAGGYGIRTIVEEQEPENININPKDTDATPPTPPGWYGIIAPLPDKPRITAIDIERCIGFAEDFLLAEDMELAGIAYEVCEKRFTDRASYFINMTEGEKRYLAERLEKLKPRVKPSTKSEE